MMLFFIGLLLGAALLALGMFLRSRGIRPSWYEWLIATLGFMLLVFALQNYRAARADFEPVSPGVFLLIFGLPGLILMLLAAFLIWMRMKNPISDLRANRKTVDCKPNAFKSSEGDLGV
jgi:uncharacterized membrane protein